MSGNRPCAVAKRLHEKQTLPTGPSMHLSADGWGQTEGEVGTKSGARQKKRKREKGLPFPSGPCFLCVFFNGMRP